MIDSRLALTAAAAAIALAGCGTDDSPVAEHANEGVPPAEVAIANDARAADIRNQSMMPGGSTDGPIPAPLHGRWGLTPRDCEAPPGSAQGLLVVTADDLLFYETRAEPIGNIEASGDSISGEFAFTGEGQSERRFQALQLQGDQLVRTGNGPAGSFTYVRCEPEPR